MLKLTCLAGDLTRPLYYSKLIKKSRYSGTLSVLNHCLVRSDPPRITTTNLETTLTAEMSTMDESVFYAEGTGLVPIDIYNILSIMDHESLINIASDENNIVTLSSGRNKYHFASLDYADFPMIKVPADAQVKTASLSIRDIEFAQHAIAKEDVRIYLSGVNIANDMMVSSDGHRLARSTISHDPGINAIIRPDFMLAISHIARETGFDSVTVDVVSEAGNPFLVAASMGGISVVSNLIAGPYPDCRGIIPSLSDHHRISIDRIAAMSSLRKLILVQSAKSDGGGKNDDSIKVAAVGETIKFESRNGSTDVIDIIAAPSDNVGFDIGISAKYLLDAVSAFVDEIYISLWWVDSNHIIITSADDTDTRLAMVMGRRF